jgi:hypothetical protein
MGVRIGAAAAGILGSANGGGVGGRGREMGVTVYY